MSTRHKGTEFSWSTEELTLKAFVDYYRHRLPLFIKVTQGYCGYGEDRYTYSTEEVYRITHVNTQVRVICRDASGRLLSIPAEYPIKFHVIEKRKQLPATSLKVFLKLNQFRSGMKVIPENGAHLKFWVGADKTMKTDIGTLELLDIYEDLYLVGNVISSNGIMESKSIYIPLFMKIKVVLANGIKHKNDAHFHHVLQQYCEKAANFNNAIVKGNPEIMFFDKREMKEQAVSSDYIYIEPKSYISCAQVAALRHLPAEATPNTYTRPIFIQDIKPATPATKSLTPKQMSYRMNKPLPPLPDEKSSSWPKKSNPTTINSTGNTTPIVQRLQPHNRTSQGAGYMVPNRNQSNIHEKHSSISSISDDDTDIKPYGTYQEFTRHAINFNSSKNSTDNKYCVFSNFNEVPNSLTGVPKKGVSDCLKMLHLDSYVQLFHNNDIDGTLLSSMDKDSLVELGLSKFEANKLYQFINGWRPID